MADAKLLAVIEANTKQFENALKRVETLTDRTFARTEKSVKRLDNSFKSSAAAVAKFGRSLGIAFSGAAAIALAARTIRAFIDNTIESEAAVAQLNATLQSTGGVIGLSSKELQDLAAALQKVTVFSDEAIISVQSQLATFRKVGADIFPQATEAILDLATKMGGDLKGATVQLGKALQDPIKGITALTRVGVSFEETQKTLITNFVKTGQLSKAQAIILKELQTEFGGSARAARDTLGGALTALGEAWGDLFEVSGPASDQLRLAIEEMIKAISDPKFKEAVAVIGSDLLNALRDIIGLAPQFASEMRNIRQSINDFGAGVEDWKQTIDGIAEQIGRDSGAAKISNMLGLGDEELARIAQGHEAVLRHAEDLELLAALQKKFTIAPGTPAPTGGAGIVGFDPDALDEAAAAEAELADQIEAEAEAQKEAEQARKRAADELVRQKEAVVDLISDLEFEKSLIGLSNEQREIEIALRRAGAVATQEQQAQIAGLVASGLAEQKALDDLIDRMDEIRNAAGGALSAFNDALRNGEGLAGGLKSALESVLDTVIRIAEQKAIESLFGAFGTAGGGGGIGAIIGGIFGGFKPGGGTAAPFQFAPQALPSAAGMRSAMTAGGHAPAVVHLMIDENQMFASRVVGISGAVAARVVHSNNKVIPTLISSQRARGLG